MSPHGWNLNPMASYPSEQPNSVTALERPPFNMMTGLAIRKFQSCIQSLRGPLDFEDIDASTTGTP